ncbi:MAG: GNAT family N-acetyltransferase [Saprospiraceae bacterium]|nr:GNAT family N-acetyltransferase [Saprospiraceae bacterium]
MNGSIALKTDQVSYEYYGTLDKCHETWDQVAGGEVYLTSQYLQLVEDSVVGLKPQYFIVKEGHDPIGIVYFQEYPFYALKSFNSFTTKNSGGGLAIIRRLISRLLSFNAVANGNMMLTGPHGFCFKEHISLEKQLELVDQAFKQAISKAKEQGPISLHFLKELDTAQDGVQGDKFEADGFYRFTVQPTMHFQVDPEWSTMEDYLAAIKSKYRVRYRKARKRGIGLEKRKLEGADIRAHQDRIHALYHQVLGESSFNLMEVNDTYFANLAEALGSKFTFNGYFQEDQLIGFMSFIDTPEVLEAHFTGIDQTKNRNCDLYLNMLFDLVEEAIVGKKEMLNLSRTALEIKSSIGAVPVDMYCYLRHRNGLLNRLLPKIFKFLYKEDEWTQRIPYKAD